LAETSGGLRPLLGAVIDTQTQLPATSVPVSIRLSTLSPATPNVLPYVPTATQEVSEAHDMPAIDEPPFVAAGGFSPLFGTLLGTQVLAADPGVVVAKLPIGTANATTITAIAATTTARGLRPWISPIRSVRTLVTLSVEG